MDGRRAVAAADHAADGDHDDVHQQMFPIPRVPGIGERLEVGTDRFDVDPFGGHARHPGRRPTASPRDPRSRPDANAARSPDVADRGRSRQPAQVAYLYALAVTLTQSRRSPMEPCKDETRGPEGAPEARREEPKLRRFRIVKLE